MNYYKGLNEDWKDIHTGKTLYTKGKVIKIPNSERGNTLCKEGLLHASKDIFGIFKSINPIKFCLVSGEPVVKEKDKCGFHEYKVVKRLTQKEVNKLLKMNYDLTPITDYFKRVVKPTKGDVKLLKEWYSLHDSVRGSVYNSVWQSVLDSVWHSVLDSVRDSVRDSVWDSVRGSVWHSVQDSVWHSVQDSVRGSVWDSAWDSVWYSVWDSVLDSVRGSVWHSVQDSVYCYFGSLFTGVKKWKGVKHEEGVYPFQVGADLIKKGLMPCTDGKKLYLLSGKAGTKWKIVHEEELKE